MSASYEYIDVWSSPYTWGANPPPADGDFVVIPKGMKLLLDTNTSVLKMLLIQGNIFYVCYQYEMYFQNEKV